MNDSWEFAVCETLSGPFWSEPVHYINPGSNTMFAVALFVRSVLETWTESIWELGITALIWLKLSAYGVAGIDVDLITAAK